MRSCSQPCRAFMNSFERTRDRFVYRSDPNISKPNFSQENYE
jgi:hypothetical protein